MNSLRMSLLMACVLGFTGQAGAQTTTVVFGNDVFAGVPGWEHTRVTDSFGQPITGDNFVAQLLYETAHDSFTPHLDVARFYSAPNLAGYWRGRVLRFTTANPLRLQVRVWDAGFDGIPALSFEEAVAQGRSWGVSEAFWYSEQWSGAPHISDWYMREFRGFQLVPEPGTWALLALGVGVLFWRSRRRSR